MAQQIGAPLFSHVEKTCRLYVISRACMLQDTAGACTTLRLWTHSHGKRHYTILHEPNAEEQSSHSTISYSVPVHGEVVDD